MAIRCRALMRSVFTNGMRIGSWVTFCLLASVPLLVYPEPLPRIGPAPDFRLINQDGRPVSMRALRGRIAVVTFIFTSCSDACPIVTAKLVQVDRNLGADARQVEFVAITVDPLHDSPAALKRYAAVVSAPPENFAFLTGDLDEIHDVVSHYGAYFKLKGARDVDHTFLTSIVDPAGVLRVQYMGWRFDPDEFLGDIVSIIEEGSGG